jgi:hypothetical protein
MQQNCDVRKDKLLLIERKKRQAEHFMAVEYQSMTKNPFCVKRKSNSSQHIDPTIAFGTPNKQIMKEK